jgi:hypothetical protein
MCVYVKILFMFLNCDPISQFYTFFYSACQCLQIRVMCVCFENKIKRRKYIQFSFRKLIVTLFSYTESKKDKFLLYLSIHFIFLIIINNIVDCLIYANKETRSLFLYRRCLNFFSFSLLYSETTVYSLSAPIQCIRVKGISP